VSVELTLAIGDYDHVRDLVSGRVTAEGIALNCMEFSVEETFFRFARFREWDVSEFSMGKFVSLRAAGDDSLVGIPAFPSRAFRHAAIFVREDGPVDKPEALQGGRIGIPEWTQTATVYARGLLHHDHGVDVREVDWIQAGTNEPGRIEGIDLKPPPGISITPEPDKTLNEMLLAGDLDAVIAAHPPHGLGDGIVRLFTDPRAVEEDYYARTGIFPIMHVVAIRREVVDAHPWVPMNLLTAFRAAKDRAVERALDANAPKYPVPWSPANAQRAIEIMGDDFWPYGIEPNRTTLAGFLEYAHEQGVCERLLTVDELFPASVAAEFKI
jgi:4,5-dihydroxyphthalate decarboxylase